MKLLPSEQTETIGRTFVFQIEPKEEALLLAILRMYPLLGNSYHHLSKDPRIASTAEQRLLEDSMSQQRAAHRRRLEGLFLSPQRYFKDASGERRLVLSGDQFEWLLQVLNDIRVGSWVKLGCPDFDKAPPAAELTRANARSLQLMHISGQFQAELLKAVK